MMLTWHSSVIRKSLPITSVFIKLLVTYCSFKLKFMSLWEGCLWLLSTVCLETLSSADKNTYFSTHTSIMTMQYIFSAPFNPYHVFYIIFSHSF